MRKIWMLTLLALAALGMSGCGCTRPFASWFNRGDNCGPPPCNTGGGGPYATGSPIIMGGPVESGPVYGQQ